ncbi:MAG: hypothetical protein K9J12_13205 [Melioribacteraceae bacterium]|nr:hypothetical protein [Melioribacteraceae bacterium]MCF8263842.1 hypothetical protein [Melioribacteraceae bacterium]MCF8432198.1 hypothetical protein [Melioribacteraceae bacterium]
MFKRKTIILLICSLMLSCSGIPNVGIEKVNQLANKNPENWSIDECNMIIQSFSKNNISISAEYTSDDVIVYATPLISKVILAIVRKQAIERRFTHEMYLLRLKEYLERYTKFTLAEENENIIMNENLPFNQQNEISFLMVFKNNTDLYRKIEIYKAEEGFFLENINGSFGRVKFVDSYEMDEYLYLIDEVSATITFSMLDDFGKQIFTNIEKEYYSLSLNGLDEKEIKIEWNEYSKIPSD